MSEMTDEQKKQNAALMLKAAWAEVENIDDSDDGEDDDAMMAFIRAACEADKVNISRDFYLDGFNVAATCLGWKISGFNCDDERMEDLTTNSVYGWLIICFAKAFALADRAMDLATAMDICLETHSYKPLSKAETFHLIEGLLIRNDEPAERAEYERLKAKFEGSK